MGQSLRNPFRIRASEKIDSDPSFIKLFSPIVLDSLYEKYKDGKLWENVLFIHSSPGAGKTSLLRVFEPSTLNTLVMNKASTEYRELFHALKRIDVIKEESIINVLGVKLSCNRNYELLEDIEIAENKKKRLFFSLLNVRIVLATLQSIAKLKQFSVFPNDLERVAFDYDNRDNYLINLNTPCSGLDLFKWASNIERQIYELIDSFLPDSVEIQGHDEVFALSILRPENLLYNGVKVCDKVLVMLDDAHKLSTNQHRMLEDYVIARRGGFSLWISSRLEVLDAKVNIGSMQGRDYDEVRLEKLWQDSPAKFEKVLRNISEKRASLSSEEITTFEEYLESNLNANSFKEEINTALLKARQEISVFSEFTSKFDSWISSADNFQGSDMDKAILLQKVLILINRNLGRDQTTLDFPLPLADMTDKAKSEVSAAAILFLSHKSNLPYYFGFNSLCKIASNNIDQFLAFSSELFEEMISKKVGGDSIILTEGEQAETILKVVDKKWNELQRVIPSSRLVLKFIKGLGEYCYKETFRPNAPYAPGVNGFSIKSKATLKLIDEVPWYDNVFFEDLVSITSICVAFNLLEIKEVGQGKEGQKWNVFYLNRWLCVKFGLPLAYGGWRHKSPEELMKWLKG